MAKSTRSTKKPPFSRLRDILHTFYPMQAPSLHYEFQTKQSSKWKSSDTSLHWLLASRSD